MNLWAPFTFFTPNHVFIFMSEIQTKMYGMGEMLATSSAVNDKPVPSPMNF